MTKTFEPGLEYRRRFSGQEYFLGVFSEGATGRRCVFVGTGRRRHDELAKEASAVANVVVLVVLGQVEHVLTQQPSLLRVRYRQLGGEVQNLQLHYVLLQKQTTHTTVKWPAACSVHTDNLRRQEFCSQWTSHVEQFTRGTAIK